MNNAFRIVIQDKVIFPLFTNASKADEKFALVCECLSMIDVITLAKLLPSNQLVSHLSKMKFHDSASYSGLSILIYTLIKYEIKQLGNSLFQGTTVKSDVQSYKKCSNRVSDLMDKLMSEYTNESNTASRRSLLGSVLWIESNSGMSTIQDTINQHILDLPNIINFDSYLHIESTHVYSVFWTNYFVERIVQIKATQTKVVGLFDKIVEEMYQMLNSKINVSNTPTETSWLILMTSGMILSTFQIYKSNQDLLSWFVNMIDDKLRSHSFKTNSLRKSCVIALNACESLIKNSELLIKLRFILKNEIAIEQMLESPDVIFFVYIFLIL